jgi:hypothetical protein
MIWYSIISQLLMRSVDIRFLSAISKCNDQLGWRTTKNPIYENITTFFYSSLLTVWVSVMWQAGNSFFVGSGSIKKRTAPLPPGSYNMYGTLPNSHSRTPSDPIVPNSHMGYHTLNHHKRSPSSDSNAMSSGTGRTGPATSIHLRKFVIMWDCRA